MTASAISEGTFEVLRIAVNVARQYRLPSVQALRDRLKTMLPDREQDIESAIKFWAADISKNHPGGRDLLADGQDSPQR